METKRRLIHECSDFRIYAPELALNDSGNIVILTLCESLENGRWEPFYSTHCPADEAKKEVENETEL